MKICNHFAPLHRGLFADLYIVAWTVLSDTDDVASTLWRSTFGDFCTCLLACFVTRHNEHSVACTSRPKVNFIFSFFGRAQIVIMPKSLGVSCKMSERCVVIGITRLKHHGNVRRAIVTGLDCAWSRSKFGTNEGSLVGIYLGTSGDGGNYSGVGVSST